jgi:hypothetical protein
MRETPAAEKLGQIASYGRGSELVINKINRLPSRDRRESILRLTFSAPLVGGYSPILPITP